MAADFDVASTLEELTNYVEHELKVRGRQLGWGWG